jgi:hypothetical protein
MLNRLNGWKSGQWLATCDVCGFVYHSSKLKKRWDNLMVCKEDYEERHPQDFLRARPETAFPEWTRPEPPDEFLAVCNPLTASAHWGTSSWGCFSWGNTLSDETLALYQKTFETQDVSGEIGHWGIGQWGYMELGTHSTSITAYMPNYKQSQTSATPNKVEELYTPEQLVSNPYAVNEDINWVPPVGGPTPVPGFSAKVINTQNQVYVTPLFQYGNFVYQPFSDYSVDPPQTGYLKTNKTTELTEKILFTGLEMTANSGEDPVVDGDFVYFAGSSSDGNTYELLKISLITNTITQRLALPIDVGYPSLIQTTTHIFAISSRNAGQTLIKVSKTPFEIVSNFIFSGTRAFTVDSLIVGNSFAAIDNGALYVPTQARTYDGTLGFGVIKLDLATLAPIADLSLGPSYYFEAIVADADFIWAIGARTNTLPKRGFLFKLSKTDLSIISEIDLSSNISPHKLHSVGNKILVLGEFLEGVTIIDKLTGNVRLFRWPNADISGNYPAAQNVTVDGRYLILASFTSLFSPKSTHLVTIFDIQAEEFVFFQDTGLGTSYYQNSMLIDGNTAWTDAYLDDAVTNTLIKITWPG